MHSALLLLCHGTWATVLLQWVPVYKYGYGMHASHERLGMSVAALQHPALPFAEAQVGSWASTQ